MKLKDSFKSYQFDTPSLHEQEEFQLCTFPEKSGHPSIAKKNGMLTLRMAHRAEGGRYLPGPPHWQSAWRLAGHASRGEACQAWHWPYPDTDTTLQEPWELLQGVILARFEFSSMTVHWHKSTDFLFSFSLCVFHDRSRMLANARSTEEREINAMGILNDRRDKQQRLSQINTLGM